MPRAAFSRSSVPVVDVVHAAVRGRVRLRSVALRSRVAAAGYVRRQMIALAGVKKVVANPQTGSVLVEFEGDALDAETLKDALGKILREAPDEPLGSPPADRRQTSLASLSRLIGGGRISVTKGLSPPQIRESRRHFGRNLVGEIPERSAVAMLASQFNNMPTALLGVSAVLAVATGGVADAALIGAVLALNGFIGFAQERSTERVIRSLAVPPKLQAQVVRDGRRLIVGAADLVVGDIVIIAPGTVAADLKLLNSDGISVDESALTGESLPVAKIADAPDDRIFRGTSVTAGGGFGIVTAVGGDTQIGRIEALLGGLTAPRTRLQINVDTLTKRSVQISVGLCVLSAGLGIWRGMRLLEVLKTSMSLAVAAVPEGLPTVSTLTLAIGIRRMRRRGIFIRKLAAVENLGAVSVLCFDKTGTLTANRMSVVETEAASATATAALLRAAVLCNDARELRNGGVHFEGSATECALMHFAEAQGVATASLRATWPRIKTLVRTESYPWMATLHGQGRQPFLIAVKGSPEHVLAMCETVREEQGDAPLDADRRAVVEAANRTMAGRGLRVLAFAEGRTTTTENHRQPRDLTWLGLLGLADPPREGMTKLFDAFHAAGIRTAMLTGDQMSTAASIGRQVGIAAGEDVVAIDFKSLAGSPADSLTNLIERSDVFSRVSPTEKLQIVRHLQKAGKIVAMTGDGINDGPALKAADVGLAMSHGAQEAQSASDAVLSVEGLEAMFDAISQGRAVRDNLRKSIHFLLSTNLSEMLATLAAVGFCGSNPFNPLELLWVNLLTDVFPALALAVEPPEPDVMRRPPESAKAELFAEPELRQIVAESVVIAASVFATYRYGLKRYGRGPHADAFAFFVLTFAQILHTRSSRSPRASLFTKAGLTPNHYVDWAMALSGIVQFTASQLRPLATFFKIEPLTRRDLAVAVAGAGLPYFINEAIKAWRRMEPPDGSPNPMHWRRMTCH